MMDIEKSIRSAFEDARSALDAFLNEEGNIVRVMALSKLTSEILQRRGRVMICGNGGSYCDALHFAEEFTGRYRKDREALPVMALGEASHVTCVGNDYGFDEIFSRQVDAFGHEGDLLIAISTSGNSRNIIRAVEAAKERSMHTAALLGKGGGKLKGVCDLEWVIPAATSDRVQEIHMAILHITIEAVERELYPEHYEPV